ncbi:bifunctional diaminohydroxyphosphoribosylaminopyrimidine deaminase/5-amino-6-(5-phosphoribosylamino)uracil reductase RibD [Chitinasiproducens palmae]|uniref:Riboflavin biosynthesis protein RibD n=1 Tax=Chitinasiproducens palmae TaxID=1770053 RepID=A0A1H2PML2_9BURK|nr:bifunctional diaminohydroxyphosphoribosylaminopyrimidine deaminase/5-amino-6-(5-phosphoribosylamino)uracil reductase RibD [Chitinasiproducens palmae]SDV47750.1 diaminohydroxyphosphoribosylaminopyrimidine deaminase / 5-amino-6-(5-phosphoribosylamino)uracil reductase [Chitinasiproducens palmae]
MYSNDDFALMTRALALAERGMYTTTPNPRVGCVLVRDGRVIGEGFTQPAGSDHAEVRALKDARARGIDVRGASAYVTLEPCSHVGRTPACAHTLVQAGIARVVAAMEDPNPRVSGRGLEILRAAGIEVRCGLLESAARELNIGFVKRMIQGRPWVRLKVAASLDGRTALANGRSQWLTGPEARRDGHRWRARACAVLTGVGTVRADDPQLTVRAIETPRQPQRVLLDSKLAASPEAKIFDDGAALVICASDDGDAAPRAARLRERGAEVVALPDADGRVDLAAALDLLGAREINELHLEAGYKLNGAWLRAGLVDELLVYMAPSLLGNHALGMFGLPALDTLDARIKLHFHAVEAVGSDLRLLLRPTDGDETVPAILQPAVPTPPRA